MRENTTIRWGGGLGMFAGVVLLILGLVLEATPADAGTARAGSRTTARWGGAVNTGSLAAVNNAYWSQYGQLQSLSTGWLGGSLLGCLPGLSSASSNAATLTSLNFVRSLAGLAPVGLSSAMNASAQRAALMMSANGALSHSPGSNWKCYTRDGATAASRSNLALSYPSIGSGQIIDLYMDEPGGNNKAVGHRRWLLNPFATVVGTGSTSNANALTVVGPTSRKRPNPRYVGWPTAGYFPNAMEPNGRWSLSAGRSNTKFNRAKVRVYHNGNRVGGVRKYRVHNGYAQPTLVWQMPSSAPKVGTYKVVVKNIRRGRSAKRFKHTYSVRLFTPTRP